MLIFEIIERAPVHIVNNMADRDDTSSPTNLRFTFQIFCTIVVLILSQHGDQVLSATLAQTNETKIRQQIKLATVCRDHTGTEVYHLDEWPSATGACDNNICFVAKSASFVIAETCREITADENPDSENCQKVGDNTKPFPDCCEKLECAESAPLTTVSPTLCFDRSPASSCLFWSSVTNGCTPNGTYYEDFLKDYCKKTCGICT